MRPSSGRRPAVIAGTGLVLKNVRDREDGKGGTNV
jgi:hypothetical protein